MNITRKIRVAAAAALAISTSFGTANADTGLLHITGAGPNPLTVTSNGQDYTKLSNLGIFTIATRLNYDTGVVGRIHGWEVTPKLIAGIGIASHAPGLNVYAESESYGWGNRPKSIDKLINLSIPMSAIDGFVIDLCQRLATSLRNGGLSNQQIFGQDREVNFTASADRDVDASGSGSGSPIWEAMEGRNVTVICKKWAGAQIPQNTNDLAPAPTVEHVSLQVQPLPTHNGQCKVKLVGLVRMNLPNVGGKVRFQHDGGDNSEQLSFTTAQNKIALVTRVVDIPKEDGVENGYFRMRVLPDQATTKWVHYSFNCTSLGGVKVTPNTPPTGPKTLQVVPKVEIAPQPRLKLRKN